VDNVPESSDVRALAISPEQRLFVGVILNAVKEAAGNVSGMRQEVRADQAQASALAWFREAGEDFEAVCVLAGLEPSNVRSGVLGYLERVKATPSAAINLRRAGDRNVESGRVSMRDVAEHAGVSAMTVARVLDGHPSVSEATRLRVQTSVLELGYSRRGGRSVH
jgi:hypothetical protein